MKTTIKKSDTLLVFLQGLFPESTRTNLKKMLSNGQIYLNGTVVSHYATPLKVGDMVEIGKGTGTGAVAAKASRRGHKSPYTVLYEDEAMVAIEKPTGINTNSDDGSESVYKKLKFWYGEQTKGETSLWMVHRLDKEVSGILLFAKTEAARAHLIEHWKEGTKVYMAFCEGRLEPASGTISGWLAENKAMKMYVPAEELEGAKWAITHYNTLKMSGPKSLVEVKLETGRKNQIRAHLAEKGCPIVGDRKYGSKEQDSRIMLHAVSLTVRHPVSGEFVTITSNLPGGFPAR